MKWLKFNDYFEFQPKDKTITLRAPEDLLNENKKIAKVQSANYQKLIRGLMIDGVSKKVS